MSIAQNKDIVHRFVDEVVNGRNQQSLNELTAPDYALHFPGLPRPVDRSHQLDVVAQLHAAFPDLFVAIDTIIAEGDWVALMITVTGTNRGPYQGLPPTGKPVNVPGSAFYRLRDGKIIEDRPLFDQMAILQQLGALPPVAVAEPALGGARR